VAFAATRRPPRELKTKSSAGSSGLSATSHKHVELCQTGPCFDYCRAGSATTTQQQGNWSGAQDIAAVGQAFRNYSKIATVLQVQAGQPFDEQEDGSTNAAGPDTATGNDMRANPHTP
jgi:hypothetical protein